MLWWNKRREWWKRIGLWCGEDRAGLLSKRLDGLAVCCVDVWEFFRGVWNKSVAAIVLSV
jgi:hypothetical protein